MYHEALDSSREGGRPASCHAMPVLPQFAERSAERFAGGILMATGWCYTRGGQQQGPVTTEELQAMVNAGEVARTDLVWNESLPSWVPVSGAPGLTAAPASTAAPAESPFAAPGLAGVLPYSAPTAEGVVATPLALEMLRQTKPWAWLF